MRSSPLVRENSSTRRLKRQSFQTRPCLFPPTPLSAAERQSNPRLIWQRMASRAVQTNPAPCPSLLLEGHWMNAEPSGSPQTAYDLRMSRGRRIRGCEAAEQLIAPSTQRKLKAQLALQHGVPRKSALPADASSAPIALRWRRFFAESPSCAHHFKI